MTVHFGAAGLRDLAGAGHGLLGSDAAVFGLPDAFDADPPGWLHDPAEVRRRIAGKPADDGLGLALWQVTAALAACCAEIDRGAGGDRDTEDLLVAYGLGLGASSPAGCPARPVR